MPGGVGGARREAAGAISAFFESAATALLQRTAATLQRRYAWLAAGVHQPGQQPWRLSASLLGNIASCYAIISVAACSPAQWRKQQQWRSGWRRLLQQRGSVPTGLQLA